MYSYSQHSTTEAKTLHPWLQLILLKTLERHDFRIEQGGRSWEEQQAFFDTGTSKLAPPRGKHLIKDDPTGEIPGQWAFAADVCPYIKGKRLATDKAGFGPAQQAQFARFLGIVEQIGRDVLQGTGWRLRFGVNWDEDAEILTDQTFLDWYHIEIVSNGVA